MQTLCKHYANIMQITKKYWTSIAERIATDFKNGHPEDWKKGDIDLFLVVFLTKLQEICRQDTAKAVRCGIPKIKGELQYNQLKLSYHSFRRIFITKESEGNLTTKEMFAIYFGYDSFNDYLIKNEIKKEEDTEDLPAKPTKKVENSNPTTATRTNRKKSKVIRLGATLLTAIIIVILLFPSYFTGIRGQAFILFRHDNGIAVINTKYRAPIQIRSEEKITGIDIDGKERLIFWSSYPDGHVSKATLHNNLKKIMSGSTRFHLLHNLPGPAGIAVNPKYKVFYCAMHSDSTIVAYDYNGQIIDRHLVTGLKGKPSSVELDFKKQVLYWTDVSNGKIGKFNLDTHETDHNFIENAGDYPDGLSVDTIDNKLYWTNRHTHKIGWTSLSNPKPYFISVNFKPAAIEVDAEKGFIYCSTGDSDIINKGTIMKNSISFTNSIFFETGNNEPSVLKLIKIK